MIDLKALLQVLVTLMFGISTVAQAARAPVCGPIFLEEKAARAELRELLRQSYNLDTNSIIHNVLLKYSASRLGIEKPGSESIQEQRLLRVDGILRAAQKIFETGKPDESLESQWVHRKILSRGIGEIMKDYGYSEAPVWAITKLFRNRAVKFLINHSELPPIRDREIPAELLEAVIKDGIDVHQNEIQSFYGSQKQFQVDAYRNFNRVYRLFALVLFAYLSWNHLQNALGDVNETKKENLNKSIDDLSEMIDLLGEELDSRGLLKD